jgi:prepilin-type N-terminal cleavage/methylation domain-containing protein
VRKRIAAGFTLIEMVIVIAIAMVLTGIAIPSIINAMNAYRFSAAVSAVAGAVQTTRFQAIMKGCQYQLIFTPSSASYQVYSEVPATGSTTGCLTSPAAVGTSIPLPAQGYVTVTGETCSVTMSSTTCTGTMTPITGSTVTYTFYPNGTVTSSPSLTGIQISNSFESNTVWVSGVGNATASSP